MVFRRLFIVFVFLFTSFSYAADTEQSESNDVLQSPQLKTLAWQHGPGEGSIAGKSTIKIPKDYVFLGEKDTSRFLQIAGNPPQDHHYLLAPKTLDWFAVFYYEDSGYIKDDDKIDADDLLKSLKTSDKAGNEERKRLGMDTLFTEGWEVKPHYDTQSKRLEWGLRLRDGKGVFTVNYTVRLLGRSGIINAVLVSRPEDLKDDINDFKSVLVGHDFVAGQRYAEFKAGDKVAEYGLAALIVGGAAAVATKKGLWGIIGGFLVAFWKLIAGVGVVAVAGIRSLFKRKS